MSVVVPVGSAEGLGDLIAALAALHRTPEDELLLADNTRDGSLLELAAPPGMIVVRAGRERSSYHARNVGAERARNAWLLFLDADCRPLPALLDEYFALPIAEDCGAVAGEVIGMAGQSSITARYASARRHLQQGDTVHAPRPFAVTANLLLRRSAWSAVGGFCEGIRSGGDVDLTWRLQDAGWTLEHRPRALVEHLHRERVQELVRQWRSYGAGSAWLSRRHADARQDIGRRVRNAGRSIAVVLASAAVGRRERAQLAALDALVQMAFVTGWFRSNRAEPLARENDVKGVVLAAKFPEAKASAEIERRGQHAILVEAARRPPVPDAHLVRELSLYYAEDDGAAARLSAAARLVARHPLRGFTTIVRDREVGQFIALAPSMRRLADRGSRELVYVDPARSRDAASLVRMLRAHHANPSVTTRSASEGP